VTAYSFAKRDSTGERIDTESSNQLKLNVTNAWFGERWSFGGVWEAPYSLPDELKSGAGITPIAVMALGAGLLSSVLTPCLLQLVVMFGGVIAGLTPVSGMTSASKASVNRAVSKRIMRVAVAFVLGFVVLYSAAGALIGAIGHQAQLVFAEYSRSIAIASGAIVIALGLWVALRGVRTVACPVPDVQIKARLASGETVGALVASMGYALGCTACFGGAIVATLIVYVGALGSAGIGAAVMLIFAIGVAIPFLLAALFISRMTPIVDFLGRNARALSYFSSAIIVAFGLILITDNFHTISDLIYPHLGLG
jgi:cytochrome c-type biogenesis protein